MNLLLDTHAFLWYYSGASTLSQNARIAIENPENDFFLSMASLWEISIKNGLGKLDLDAPLDTFFKDIILKGFNILPIDPSHILQSAALPIYHRDPFDRLIIGQALAEQMLIVTKDSLFEPYCINTTLQIVW